MKVTLTTALFVVLVVLLNGPAEIRGEGVCLLGPAKICNTLCETVHQCDRPCVVRKVIIFYFKLNPVICNYRSYNILLVRMNK